MHVLGIMLMFDQELTRYIDSNPMPGRKRRVIALACTRICHVKNVRGMSHA